MQSTSTAELNSVILSIEMEQTCDLDVLLPIATLIDSVSLSMLFYSSFIINCFAQSLPGTTLYGAAVLIALNLATLLMRAKQRKQVQSVLGNALVGSLVLGGITYSLLRFC